MAGKFKASMKGLSQTSIPGKQKVRNVFPTEDERLLLDLEGLAFEIVLEISKSQRISDEFFCTQVPRADMGQSSHGDDESSNVDMKELEVGQLEDEVPAKAEDNMEDYGVGSSRASDGDSNSEEESPDFVILLGTNVVKINDDQTTLVEPRRGRPR
ncbi:hypothetical protein K7X08_028265 [Anisodus acutangulus]|uniref:Uncharacterized protein n=1 Tax=Anisodus acutangulus TaxID=402998 RepID=A0A9Q1M502_9SOLA|nr:hypothetical protein K7X08_028265 [Anisodus acutangulus]